MSVPLMERPATEAPAEEEHEEPGWKHWGLMILCCLPMIAIALLLILGIIGR